MREHTDAEIMDLAEQIYEYFDPWERDEFTADDIAEDLKKDPIPVVKLLVAWLME